MAFDDERLFLGLEKYSLGDLGKYDGALGNSSLQG